MFSQRPAQAAALVEGDLAARDLAEALRLAGFTLPSLHGDIPTITDKALVHLGGASAEVVRDLAAWIRQRARTGARFTLRRPAAAASRARAAADIGAA
ncbi:hypothetical protein [Streptomyces sp. AFD10]|uniref:hypothetical protein n=1 Tax=Streptomyces sp. AFD10 TaxID=3050948 RepID=UPI0034DEF977